MFYYEKYLINIEKNKLNDKYYLISYSWMKILKQFIKYKEVKNLLKAN